jgi:hypothetical protein
MVWSHLSNMVLEPVNLRHYALYHRISLALSISRTRQAQTASAAWC